MQKATQRRKCPHCKSKKGFTVQYQVTGGGEITASFDGKMISMSRNISDVLDISATCLNCERSIDSDELTAAIDRAQ